MKIKAQFTLAYFITFLTVVLAALFFDSKPERGEVKGGIFYGTMFIIIIGVIISLVIETLLQTLNKKNIPIARFIIMFAILDLLFFYVSRFELVASLLEFSGQHFDTALPVILIHLICYTIAATTLFVLKKRNI